MAETNGVIKLDVDKPRESYTRMSPFWRRCQDVLDGQDAVKAQGPLYLPRLSGQSNDEYNAYRDRALFYNGTERTRFALVGAVFQKDITVDAPDSMKALLDDVDLDGTPLNDFAMLALKEVIGAGRYGVLIDMPPEGTPRDDMRPYFIPYHAAQIMNWRVAKRSAAHVLALLILKESVEAPDAKNPDNVVTSTQFRRLELKDLDTDAPYVEVTIWRTVRSNDPATTTASAQGTAEQNKFERVGKPVILTRRGEKLDAIPFVFMNVSNTKPEPEKPPLLDMVDVNLSHYRSSADLEHGEHFLLPTPWMVGLPAGTTTVPLGPTNVIKLEGQNAQAGLLEFKGEGLKQLEAALERKEDMMAVLGARLIDNQRGGAVRNETAEAVRAKNAATHATLTQMTSTVSQGLSEALWWMCWWYGLDVKDDDVAVELSRDFIEPTLTAQDITAEMLRWQSGGSSFETFYYVMTRGGRTRPGVTAEDELAAINAEESDRAARAALVQPPVDPTNPDPTKQRNQPPAKPGQPQKKPGAAA